jgi:ABC-type branched-subunit amino acid transport system substrate-binding protein
MSRDGFLETDLIIGPVFPEVQEEVARVAAKNRIPMVSPFSSNSVLVNSNSYLYQINPTREYLAEETADMVAERYANSNFIVVKTSAYEGKPEAALVRMFREKVDFSRGGKYTVFDFQREGISALKNLMSAEKENVIFIPSSVEGELSVAISNINNLADEFSITLIGANNYQQRYPSIDVAQFHNLKFKYLNPFWMDYDNPATVRFIQKFKSNFATEPNNFGVQGFDAAFYFLNALNFYGKDFNACIPYLHVNLVQGNYHFEKVSPFGGYMNKGVSVIDYQRDYTVRRERVKGQPRLVAE